MSFEKEVSSATGIWAWRSLTILANENTSSSPTLYIVRMKSNESSRPSSSNASRVELTRVNDGGFDMFKSRYSWLICDSMCPSSSRIYPS